MAERVSGVYTIVHRESGTTYVGSSQNVRRRWRIHRTALRKGTHENPHLQNAWNKYSETAFEWSLIESVDAEHLLSAEQQWLDQYWKSGAVYNVVREVRLPPMAGRKHTAETRAKISASRKGMTLSLEARQHLSRIMTGRVRSPEHCRNLALAHIGKPLSESHRRRLSESHLGQTSRAQAYPALINCRTRERIEAGTNLAAVSRQHGLGPCRLGPVVRGKRLHHKGWMLMSNYKEGIRLRYHTQEYGRLINRKTAEIIPGGVNLSALCRERGLHNGAMSRVVSGKAKSHKDWILLKE